ncbi:MAG: hypothetical protein LW852_03605 [Sediminibacterium sp.]|jgi:hypothetical protein|nr:hypothetical protein [Sediminibacterium sp.]
MKKGNHIHIDFIKFLIEKNSIPETEIPDEDEVETPQIEDDEIDNETQDDETQDEDEIIETLLNEYKKIKRQYENHSLPVKWKRKSL